MTRFHTLFVLMVVLASLLFGTGCLQETQAPVPKAADHTAMQRMLGNVTGDLQSSLDALDYTIADVAEVLGTTGISGPAADEPVGKLASYHPAILDVITYDPNGTVLAAEPAGAKVLLGQNLGGYEIVKKAISTQESQMSELLSLAEGGTGAVVTRPVFSTGGAFLGTVSVAFSPYGLVAPVAAGAMEQAPFSYMVAQTDGRILYDPDIREVGKETFNETLFAGFPEIIELARQYSGNRTGYDTYSFYGTGSGKLVSKETFWNTISLHGTEWRVLVIREI